MPARAAEDRADHPPVRAVLPSLRGPLGGVHRAVRGSGHHGAFGFYKRLWCTQSGSVQLVLVTAKAPLTGMVQSLDVEAMEDADGQANAARRVSVARLLPAQAGSRPG